MKLASLIYSFFIAFNFASADDFDVLKYPQIEIHLSDEKTPRKCTLDKSSKIYLCKDGNQSVLVKHNFFGFSAIHVDANDKTKDRRIESVNSNNTEIYRSEPDYHGDYDNQKQTQVNKQETIIDEYLNNSSNVDFFFSDITKKPGPELNSLVTRLKAKADTVKKQYDQAIRASEYDIQLSNGQKISCQRLQQNPKVPAYNRCHALSCDKVNIDGKDYESILYPSFSSGRNSSIHFFDNDGFASDIDITSVSLKNSKILVEENSHLQKIKQSSEFAEGMADQNALIPQSLHHVSNIINFHSDQGQKEVFNQTQENCLDPNNKIKSYANAKEKLKDQLSNAEMVEFIRVLADGTLFGLYVDPSAAIKTGCYYNGVFFDSEAAKHLDKLKKNLRPDLMSPKTISAKKADELFKKARNMKDIAWGYKYDGCYARAHLMARRFEAEGVHVDKAWIKGDLYVPGTDIQWNYHVAPLVYVNDGKGKVKKMVIDPSLFDKPVTLEEWDKKIAKKTKKGSVMTSFPYPENVALLERSALTISSSDPYTPFENINLSESDKIELANDTMREYLSY